MEPYAKIYVSLYLQPHRTVVANFVPGNFGLFQRNPEVAQKPGWKTLAWSIEKVWKFQIQPSVYSNFVLKHWWKFRRCFLHWVPWI